MTVIDQAPMREIYNCGPANPTSIYDVVVYCAAVLAKDVHDLIEVVGDREGQDGCYWLNSEKLKGLGWEEEVGLQAAVYRVSDWIDRHPDILTMSTEWSVRP
jgi:dTDP-D-glucose 4,6-dehydratase